jgi:hypothetical protein
MAIELPLECPIIKLAIESVLRKCSRIHKLTESWLRGFSHRAVENIASIPEPIVKKFEKCTCPAATMETADRECLITLLNERSLVGRQRAVGLAGIAPERRRK